MPALFCTFERDLPGVNYMDFGGKGLSAAYEVLEAEAERQEVTQLWAFVDEWETLKDFGEPVPEEFQERRWFPAEDGLRTVNALLAFVEAQPAAVPEHEAVLMDLQDLKRFLELGNEIRARFALIWDI